MSKTDIEFTAKSSSDGDTNNTVALATYRTGLALRRFRPALTLGNQQQLLSLVEEVVGSDLGQQVGRVGQEIAEAEFLLAELSEMGLSATDVVPTLSYLAALRVLRDLLLQGWAMGVDDEGVYLFPPLVSALQLEPGELKTALRESFDFARRAQLSDATTSKFIRDMERRGIQSVLGDGVELAARLTSTFSTGELNRGICPCLELITPDALDDREDGTVLRLQDIWRYSRHFWSIPYKTSPGRNLFYLVRDDAGPGRPVMAIAALGNPLLRLTQRDDRLGWTNDSLRRRLEDSDSSERLTIGRHLARVVSDAINDTYTRDLHLDRLSADERVAHLREVEREASMLRDLDLSEAGGERTAEYKIIRDAHTAVQSGHDEDVDWERLATTALYRRKRATTLINLIRATKTLHERDVESNPDALLRILLEQSDGCSDDVGKHAIETSLRRIKQRVLAEHVLELTTCGAVPPYNEVLGGKLVAMLMTSPRVVADVHRRYQGRASLIASAMKGAPVRRESRLAYLTTSSLYSAGSTQYDGIRVPGQNGTVSFRRLGVTESYGTVHFAQDTAADLTDLAWRTDARNRRLVNNLFGEGMSAKMRALRSGLDAIGLPSDTFMRHHSPRVLYGASLCHNIQNILLGLEDQPDYILGCSEDLSPILDYWRTRWVQSRIDRPETIRRMKEMRQESLLLGSGIPEPLAGSSSEGRRSSAAQRPADPNSAGPDITFVERVYRSVNSYADRLSSEELNWIHVDLGLDDAIRAAAEKSNQILITGNPGDGKTHIVERLRPDLERLGSVVITDANALSDEEILAKWKRCDVEGRLFVLAINEWPLFALQRQDREFSPLREALRQVREAVYYLTEPDPPDLPVLVVDLSLRNVLAPSTVREVINRLTHDRFYEGLHSTDPAVVNRESLRRPRVQERLTRVLSLVARREDHTTMRQLLGFIAFLITGGETSTDRMTNQGSDKLYYATLAFDGGAGGLFSRLHQTFDPSLVSHPSYDMDLWRGVTNPSDWLDKDIASVGPQRIRESARINAYRALKRRFFFEHFEGEELLSALPTDEGEFEELFTEALSNNHAVVRDLVLAINRFFQPDCSADQRDELILWQSHRFDVRAPETFLALRRVPHHQFRIEPPKLASWATSWLSQDQWLPRTFALVGSSATGTVVAQLLVDRELFLTLRDAQRGLGRASWSRSTARKITRFVDSLHRVENMESWTEDVRVRNTVNELDRTFEVQRSPARYML